MCKLEYSCHMKYLSLFSVVEMLIYVTQLHCQLWCKQEHNRKKLNTDQSLCRKKPLKNKTRRDKNIVETSRKVN